MKYKNYFRIFTIDFDDVKNVITYHKGNSPKNTKKYKAIAEGGSYRILGYELITEEEYCKGMGRFFPYRNKLKRTQKIFLRKAYKLWSEMIDEYDYFKSFNVAKNVLINRYYVENQKPYLNNIREWYIQNKKLNK